MQQIQEVVTNGLISVVVVLIGLVFNSLRDFIVAKAKYVRANTDKKQLGMLMDIGETVVNAVEQISGTVKGQEKFEMALTYLARELSRRGIEVSPEQQRLVIEAAVREMNLLKNDVVSIVTDPNVVAK